MYSAFLFRSFFDGLKIERRSSSKIPRKLSLTGICNPSDRLDEIKCSTSLRFVTHVVIYDPQPEDTLVERSRVCLRSRSLK